MILNTPAGLPLNGSKRRKLLNQIEMLWHVLMMENPPVWLNKTKILLGRVGENSSTESERLIARWVAQTVIGFRGQLCLHMGPGRFRQHFSFNK